MLGFILGAACVVFVAKALRRHRAWHAYGYGGGMGCGHARGMGGMGPLGYEGHGPFGGGGGFRGPWNARGRGGRWALRALFERLETTPGQERAIAQAIDELRDNRKALKQELAETRGDLARALEGGLVEDSTLEETFARQDRALARLRVSFVEALKKVTEALDAPQRKQLAAWLERGSWRPGSPFGGGVESAWL